MLLAVTMEEGDTHRDSGGRVKLERIRTWTSSWAP